MTVFRTRTLKHWAISLLSLLLAVLFHWTSFGGLWGLSVLAAQPGLAQQRLGKVAQAVLEPNGPTNGPTNGQTAPEPLARSAQQNYANGDYATAIQQWAAARQLLEASGDSDGVSRLLIYEAQALESLGQSRRACNTLLRSLNAEAQSCNELRLATAPETAVNETTDATPDESGLSEPSIAGLPSQIVSRNQVVAWRLLGESLQLIGQPDVATGVLSQSIAAAQAQGLTAEVHRGELALINSEANRLRSRDLAADRKDLSKLKVRLTEKIQSPEPEQLTSSYVRAVQRQLGDYERLAAAIAGPDRSRTQAQLNGIRIALEGVEVLMDGLQELQTKAAELPYDQLVRTRFFARQGGILHQSQQWAAAAEATLEQLQAERSLDGGDRADLYGRLNLFQGLLRYEKLRQRQPLNTASLPKLLPTPQAVQQLEAMLSQARSNDDGQAEAYILGYLSDWLAQGDQTQASERYLQAGLTAAQAQGAAELAYGFQWRLGRIERAKGNFEKAKQAYKASLQSLEKIRGDLVATNREIQFSFRDSVEPVYREYADLLLAGEPTDENLKNARDTIQRLKLAEIDDYFREPCALPRAPLDEAVANAPQKTAAIYTVLLEDRLELLLKLPDQEGLEKATVPVERDRLEQVIADALGGARTARTAEFRDPKELKDALGQLYNWLIRPLQSKLSGVETLVFMLDGPLGSIPLAALYNQDQQRFLVEDYNLAVAPSIQLVRESGLPGDSNTSDSKTSDSETSHAQLDSPSVQPVALAAALSKSQDKEFPPLKHTKGEIEYLKNKTSGKFLTDQEFTPQQLRSSIEKQDFSIVHFATHGRFGSTADDTFLLAWETRIKVNELSDLLKTQTQRQSNPIDLLVLSACQTAKGDRRAALGISGVAFRAGARSVLATLWSIDEVSSVNFVESFYGALLDDGKTKAEALRAAQIQMIQSGQPIYHWAPFTLLGNWV